MYFRVLNIRSSSTDPGTITLISSASLTHAPKWSYSPRRVASFPPKLLGPALKLACCYLGAANAAAEVVQVVLFQTSILQPIAACRLQAVFSPMAHPSVCTWEAHPSALAMQTAWLWSHHAFPPLPSITLSLLTNQQNSKKSR